MCLSFYLLNQIAMKKITLLLFLALLLVEGNMAWAATVTISVKNNTFLPEAVTINPGDVIQFQWMEGSHTATSDNGAWNSINLSSAMPTGTVSGLAPGTYLYHCSFHGAAGGLGMAGSITVRNVAGLKDNAGQLAFSAYPNPTTGLANITLNTNSSDNYKIYISNVVGSVVKNIEVGKTPGEQKIQVDLGSLPSGMYFCTLLANDKMIETRRIVLKRQ